MSTDETKPMWDEVIREIPRMWEQRDYSFTGEYFRVPTPHNVLPKPYGKGHPPIWVACGNPGTFTKAGQHGIGAIAFNFEPIHNLKGRVDAYKEAIQSPTDQIGQYKNDNVMMTNAVICLKDRARAREIAMTAGRGYLVTMVNLYHDTMPKSPDARDVARGAGRARVDRRDPRHADRRRLHALRHARRGVRAGRALPGRRLRPGRLRAAG